MKIYKETLAGGMKLALQLPVDAKILKLAIQHEKVTFWYSFEDEVNKKQVTFYKIGTGWDMGMYAPTYNYIDTLFEEDLVFHYYTNCQLA